MRRCHRRRHRLLDYGTTIAVWTCPQTSCTTSAGTRSSALRPWAPHPHVERRYLTFRARRADHVIDVKDDPVNPADDRRRARGPAPPHRHSRPHTVHCGPDGPTFGVGNPSGDGPGGVLPSTTTTCPQGAGDRPRPAAPGLRRVLEHRLRHAADQRVGHAEHGRERHPARPPLSNQYGHHLHAGTRAAAATSRRSISPRAPDGPGCVPPTTAPLRLAGVVVSTADQRPVWLWRRQDDGSVAVEKVITILAEPEPDRLPDAPKPFSRATTGHRHRADIDKELFVRAGAPASSSATTSESRQPEGDRQRAHRRHRRALAAPRRGTTGARRWRSAATKRT